MGRSYTHAMATILLAEDDETMRRFIALALERAGHSVTQHNNGLDAFLDIERHPTKYDLLLTDIVMPGMDGIELSQKATAIRLGFKIMFITGFTAIAAAKRDDAPEGTKVIAKPFHLKELVDQVQKILAA